MNRLFSIVFYAVSAFFPLLLFWALKSSLFSPRLISGGILVIGLLYFFVNRSLLQEHSFRQIQFWVTGSLMLLLAILTFTTQNLQWIKLYPVAINLFLFSTFGYTLVQPPNIIFRFTTLWKPAYLDSPQRPQIEAYCQKVTQIWCGFFILNISISLVTAFFTPDWVWSLYNGLISYLLMGLLFLGEFIVRTKFLKR